MSFHPLRYTLPNNSITVGANVVARLGLGIQRFESMPWGNTLTLINPLDSNTSLHQLDVWFDNGLKLKMLAGGE